MLRPEVLFCQKNIEYIAQIDDKSKAPELAFLCSLLMILLGAGFVFLDDNFKETILNPPTITGNLRQMGLTGSSVAILLITAIFKTALAEEIFFRGFIAKLFIRKINFKTGNIIQAVLFGIIHVLLLVALSSADALVLFLTFVIATLFGWAIGYVNEQVAKGSIFPGIIAHALGNIISYVLVSFVI